MGLMVPQPGGMVLLWENSDTSQLFPNQKISIDLTKYTGVLVSYRNSQSSNYLMAPVVCFKGLAGRMLAYTTAMATRNFSVDNTGVNFTDASNQGANIPYRIYGIRW